MSKRTVFIILTILLLVSIFSLLSVQSSADFGDYAGDSDFGDFGSDSDSFGLFDVFGILSWMSNTGMLIPAIIITVIILIVVGVRRSNNTSINIGSQRTPASELNNISSLKQKDPLFSEEDIVSMVSNLYIRMQNCWSAKNIEELRPYLSDALYARTDAQLDQYRKSQTTNRIDRPAVLNVTLLGWKSSLNTDSIIISLRTRIVDYVIRDQDGSIVRGSNTAEKFMEYEWEIVRSSSVRTSDKKDNTVHNCPNCGAPLNINRTAKCEYCDSIITIKEFDWLINSIKAISQQS